MRIFNRNEKVNFVDDNNVFVGYDMSQHCCENADYFFCDDESKAQESKIFPTEAELEHYCFDTEYDGSAFNDTENYYGGDSVAFRLIAPGKPFIYLVLYNSHNGYYSHGFEAKIGDKSWKDGYL